MSDLPVMARAWEEALQRRNALALSDADAQAIAAHRPDLVLSVVIQGRRLAGCSLWWSQAPQLPGHRLGILGHYGAQDDAAAGAILNAACATLAGRGLTLAVGPMDGNTWRRYRLVVDPGDEPRFLLEPWNPPEHPRQFADAGFGILAQYTSAVLDDLGKADPRAEPTLDRLAGTGLTIEPLRDADYERVTQEIFDLSLQSFRHNFLYTPLDRAEFAALYARLRPAVDPRLVLLARRGPTLEGFAFSLPDAPGPGSAPAPGREPGPGKAPGRVVIKTLAIRPARENAGLGVALLHRSHEAARDLGFTRAIHALMHQSNRSTALTARIARAIRHYALFARALDGRPLPAC